MNITTGAAEAGIAEKRHPVEYDLITQTIDQSGQTDYLMRSGCRRLVQAELDGRR